MADIRIKDLATTASSTAADDFLAVDGTTNGTRKLSAATPSFATSVTVPGVAGPTATDLTLAGGSTGASLVLGQGASKAITLTTGSGNLNISGGKVGIGASSPLAPLSVQQTGTAPSGYASATNSGITVDFGVNDNGVINLVGGGQLGIYHSNSSNAYDVGIDFGNNADRIVKIVTANAERARFTSTGNLLIGTTTDGGQKLQVNGTASFAGAVSTTSTGFSATNASGSVEFLGSRSSTGNGVTVTYKTGATLNWFHGLRGLVDNNWYLFNNSTSTNTLIFDYGTNAATFAGAVTTGGKLGVGTAVANYAGILNGLSVTADSGLAAVYNSSGAITTAAANDQLYGLRIDNSYSNGGAYANTLGAHLRLHTRAFTGFAVGSGLEIGNITGATANFAIRSGSGVVSFGDTTPSTGAGSGALQVAGGIYSGAASVFGGGVTARQGSGTDLSGQSFLSASSSAYTSNDGLVQFRQDSNQTATNNVLVVKQMGTGGGVLDVQNSSGSVFRVLATGAATFAGAVAINNTVAAAAGVASTHKVTMVIGGVTYYLLASNV